ncbi:hypothetical protein L107_01727 [Cyanobium sp. Copco_Reservoir_LC18]|uniref:hypothetical protein n=1 Tax=Cyanobium sp. Copco_Reservoir_LC18 TaxID=1328305 RepID=UPI001359A4BB|nr:hypothetical protein [Cyanobium sp. Copco_Reservoir_LC18]KAF0654746.1 hypothetical protein L107_01727 [Cyanobium sp. Copco_Reservoir_LC18]
MIPGPGRGLLLALLQGGLLLSLAGQLLLDRATRPRGWILSEPVDPHLPIRGRYVNLALLVPAPEPPAGQARPWSGERLVLRSEADRVRAALAGPATPRSKSLAATPQGERWRLVPSVAYFIPPGVADPSRRPTGEQLWVEVTLPAQGPPRPIRLGVKRGEGPIIPLALR